MEIVTWGTLPDRSITQRCGNCLTVMKFDRSEIKTYRGDRPYEPDTEYVKCPLCGKDVYL